MGGERFVGDQGALFDEGAENRSLPRRLKRPIGVKATRTAFELSAINKQLIIDSEERDSPQTAAA